MWWASSYRDQFLPERPVYKLSESCWEVHVTHWMLILCCCDGFLSASLSKPPQRDPSIKNRPTCLDNWQKGLFDTFGCDVRESRAKRLLARTWCRERDARRWAACFFQDLDPLKWLCSFLVSLQNPAKPGCPPKTDTPIIIAKRIPSGFDLLFGEGIPFTIKQRAKMYLSVVETYRGLGMGGASIFPSMHV